MREIKNADDAIEICLNAPQDTSMEEWAEIDHDINKWYYDDKTTDEERWEFTKSGFGEMLGMIISGIEYKKQKEKDKSKR